jgi:putative transposase
MIERENTLVSLKRQCELLGICRSSLYYKPSSASDEDLELMRKIDEQYLKTPFYGYRRMTICLQRAGYGVNFKKVRRLMRLMGLEAIYQHPRTSKSHPDHKIYPYLLKDMTPFRPNQVWAVDITYIPMKRGFLYLVALMDWVSRYVLSWRLSNTLEADFCCEALEESLRLFGVPDIHNSDQGSQFTSERYVGLLISHGAQISMDGRGRFLDNIFVERLWRSVKYEEVYLKAYETVIDARKSLATYFHFYNNERPHEALGYKTPYEVFRGFARPDGFVGNSREFSTIPQAPQQLLQNDLLKKEKGVWFKSPQLVTRS